MKNLSTNKNVFNILIVAALCLCGYLISTTFFSEEEAEIIHAPHEAEVTKIHVEAGQEIKKGDVLLQLNSQEKKEIISIQEKDKQIHALRENILILEAEVKVNQELEKKAEEEFSFYTNEEARYALARRKPNISESEYKKNRRAELEVQGLKEKAKTNFEEISMQRAKSEKTLDDFKIAYNQELQKGANPLPPQKETIISNKNFEYIAPYDAKVEEILVKEGDNVNSNTSIITLIPIL